MPKVISRAVVSSSEQAKPLQSSRAVLRSYYCLCGDFVLVMQGKLERLPRRKQDGSYIVRSMDGKGGEVARKFKLSAQPGQRCLIQKGEGVEPRQLFNCSRCNTTIAYQTNPPPVGSSPFLYILKGSMSEMQGRVPYDAFDGEEKVKVKAKVKAKEEVSAAGEVPVLGDEHPVVDSGDEDDEEGDLDPDYVETEVKE